MSISSVFLLLALVCFLLKAFAIPAGREDRQIDFTNLGFAFVVASVIIK